MYWFLTSDPSVGIYIFLHHFFKLRNSFIRPTFKPIKWKNKLNKTDHNIFLPFKKQVQFENYSHSEFRMKLLPLYFFENDFTFKTIQFTKKNNTGNTG